MMRKNDEERIRRFSVPRARKRADKATRMMTQLGARGMPDDRLAERARTEAPQVRMMTALGGNMVSVLASALDRDNLDQEVVTILVAEARDLADELDDKGWDAYAVLVRELASRIEDPQLRVRAGPCDSPTGGAA